MRIGIDISAFSSRQAGIVRYISKLVESLGQIDAENEYILFYNALRGTPPGLAKLGDNFRLVTRRVPNRLLYKIWSVSSLPSVEMLTGPIDVFHAPGFPMPPVRAAAVLTVHDIAFFTHPELAGPKGLVDFAARIRQFLNRADLIVTDSDATANELSACLNIGRERMVTVYFGKPDEPKAGAAEIEAVNKKFGIESDYVLFVGCLEPRKNLTRLIKAFEQSGLASDVELVMCGPLGWRTDEIFYAWDNVACRNRIRWLKFVSDQDLMVLYSGALFLAFPSLVEGFGLPILEAMSVGCPVMTSNVSSMPEVAGNAALYVDPLNVDSIAEGLTTLAGDSQARARLSSLGYDRAAQFTWEKTAREMIRIYERAGALKKTKKRGARQP